MPSSTVYQRGLPPTAPCMEHRPTSRPSALQTPPGHSESCSGAECLDIPTKVHT